VTYEVDFEFGAGASGSSDMVADRGRVGGSRVGRHSAARSEMNASAASRSNVPAPPPPSAANAPPPWPAGVSSALGSLRVESDEPGDVFIENAEYGPTPQVIQNLPAGPHRVLVRFHAGDSSSRVIGVQGGAETSVHFEATDSLNAYRVREGAHFGFGLETAVALGDEEDVIPTFRLFGRVNYAVTRVFEVRADLVLGSYGVGQWYSEDSFSYDAQGHQNAFGVSVRPDIQINWGSIYTLSLGVDLGLNSHNGLMYGVHASPLSLRFGPKREFLLNIQAGALANRDDAVLDVVAQLSYLLL
jgi:hypothetical protein